MFKFGYIKDNEGGLEMMFAFISSFFVSGLAEYSFLSKYEKIISIFKK